MMDLFKEGKDRITVTAAVIGVLSVLFLVTLIWTFRPFTQDGVHFQVWSSETMMQTVALEDLSSSPLVTLWNIHIQPPALDFIRAILVNIWPSTNPLVAIAHVDILLYGVWSLLFGLLAALIFVWVSKLLGTKLGIVAAVLVAVHPASIFFATYLEGTFLTAVLFTAMYYLLWRISRFPNTSFIAILLAMILLFFTRAIFQWQFFLIIGLSLFLVKMEYQNIGAFLAIGFVVLGLYLVKQQVQFGIFSTTSLTGLNLSRSVGMNEELPNYWGYLDDIPEVDAGGDLPKVLTRTRKANGATNFNHYKFLELNRELKGRFLEYIQAMKLGQLVDNYLENLSIYLKPSSRFSQHVIVDRLAWRPVFDSVFSSPSMVVLAGAAGLSALVNGIQTRQIRRYIGLLLPAAYIFTVSVLAEKGENMRFKFFLEPVMIVFITYHLNALWGLIRRGSKQLLPVV